MMGRKRLSNFLHTSILALSMKVTIYFNYFQIVLLIGIQENDPVVLPVPRVNFVAMPVQALMPVWYKLTLV